ncbi:hypothetical protein WISP_97139 [Willisornis vidua]|uniref:Alpha/beta hydrolase fold-3 domain-containing protein n=1 Tax=Willisornis vidua TaxID=1566151 RepID=A0ABQ9D2K6_9PASS|nr:hypothetical protein WISP_97139 [Willisornis vidua]
MELLAIFLAVLAAFVAIAFYYEHPRAEIPHGFSERRKLYVLHYIMNLGFGLATFLDKVGIVSEVHCLRVLMETIPPFEDKRLLIKDLRFERVKVRIYQPQTSRCSQRRGVLYFHGGVGRLGSIRAYERTCRYLARKSDSVVVSVGEKEMNEKMPRGPLPGCGSAKTLEFLPRYRLAPEHPFPAQFEDCLAATTHLLRTAQDHGVDPARVIICGDSSGGTLTAAVAQALVNRGDVPKLRAQILIYPFLQSVDFNLPSYQQNERVPILLKERTVILGLKYFNKDLSLISEVFKGSHVSEDLRLKYQKWVSPDYIPQEFKTRGYKPSPTHPSSEETHECYKSLFDPVFSPLLAEDNVVAQLPETFILTCEFDVLRDDGLLYKKRLEDHGIKVTWCHLQEGFHGTVFLAGFGGAIAFRSGIKGLKKIGKVLQKLRICNDLTVLRVALDGIPPWRDSQLLIKDLRVDEGRSALAPYWADLSFLASFSSLQEQCPDSQCLRFHSALGRNDLPWAYCRARAFERLCRYVAKKCNSVVVSVGYRLAPEHPYPGQYFDCLSATLYFMRNLEEYHVDPALIVISGDSCGANFATVICQILLNNPDLPKVRAQVLLYPGLQGLDFQLPSYQQNASVPMLFRKLVLYFCFRYLNKEPTVLEDVLQNCHVPESMRHKYKKWVSADLIPDEFKIRGYVPPKPTSYKPEVHEAIKEILALTFSPLLAEDSIICQLPEAYIVTCEFDVLRDDGLLYKKRLEDNGVRVTWYHSDSGFHGIVAFFGYGIFDFVSGKKIVDSMVNYINSL